ncbi:MAG: hypothetical protein HY094_01075 [Candidatus Melainabacteria bacterium]|nr:hypothetical protein [Candidatus Melainabacteria bacterium]
MANKIIKKYRKILFVILLLSLILSNTNIVYAIKVKEIDRQVLLTNFNHINITLESSKDLKQLKKLIKYKRPRAIYIEQWVLDTSGNKSLLEKLQKISQKYNTKLYLIIGRNSWFGKRGVLHTLEALNTYGKHVDGIVLRVEPHKVNVWKDDLGIQAQILNQMLDAYSAIYIESKKTDKHFLAEFPFWLSDFKGPKKTFSQNACDYTDKIIFLLDNTDKLKTLDINWNDVSCNYIIDLTKRANNQTEELIHETYEILKSKLIFYSNFNGFLIDSDSTLKESE